MTFGADLTPAVTSQSTCSNSFAANSCLAYSVVPTSYAPASGVVSTVRVKTGDFAQGPMQVVVLRSYYQNNPSNPGHPNYYCCFLQEYGPTFTPNRNAVTTVPVTLGMVEDPTPAASDGNTVAKGDFLALSVLDGTVPIPLSPSSNGLAGYYAPAPQSPNQPSAPSANALTGGQGAFPGRTLMLNADLDPIGGGGAGPVGIDTTAARLNGNAVTLPLVCRLTTVCAGTLLLRNAAAASARAARGRARKRPVLLGSARFSIRPGKRVGVKVRLNPAGRRFVRHRRTSVLFGTVTTGGRSTTVRLPLKAAKRR